MRLNRVRVPVITSGQRLFVAWGLIFSALVSADITYTLHLDGVDAGIRTQITNSMKEAVGYYNCYGSFNKHLNIYYNAGVPTAQANYDGVITFGGSRNARVALHEMGHTMGIGTYWRYGQLMVNGVWQGSCGRALAIEMGGYGDGLHGDGTHIWPWGLNYDNEDSFTERVKHVRIMAATRCDMGILAFTKEPAHQLVSVGETAVFRVESPLAGSYQWYKQGALAPLANGGRISGATTGALQIANVQVEDTGRYYCVISGELASRSAGLMVPSHVGYWPLTGTLQDTIGRLNGSGSGPVAYAPGRFGSAIDLDGAGGVVTLPAGVADAADLTVAAWVNWDGGDNWQRLFDFGNNTNQYLFLCPRTGSNTMRFAIRNGGAEQAVETSVLPAGQWVHVAVTLSGSTARLYVNGVAAASNPGVTINPIDFAPVYNYLGDSQFSADPTFNGRIDELHIYSYALTSGEIQNLMQGRPGDPRPAVNATGTATQLALSWKGGFAGERAWQVYLGSSQAAVNTATPDSAEYLGVRHRQQAATPMLAAHSTYYWRVDALTEEGSVVKGDVWAFTTGAATGQVTPKFAGWRLEKPQAIEGFEYSQSLAGDVTAAGSVSFEKLGGPKWMTISPEGLLTGTPPEGSAGPASCTVRATDGAGWADEAVVTLAVRDLCSGTRGMDDLTRLAEEWLYAGAAFNPADLNQDGEVDLADWSMFALRWNLEIEPGLVAAWSMNNAFGETIRDALGRSPGTLENMDTTWRPLETIAGERSYSLAFDGVNDAVTMTGLKGVSGGADRTCSAWIKTTQASGIIIGWGGDAPEALWVVRVNETGGLRTEVNGGMLYGTTPLNDGRWHHVAVVLEDDGTPDVGEVKLYVDGQLEPIAASYGRPVNTTADWDVVIGYNRLRQQYFKGLIDDVRIYDRALGDDEIAALARTSVLATAAYWRFEEGPAGAAVSHGGAADGGFYPGTLDSSGNGNHLSVHAEGWAGFAYRADVSGSTLQSGTANTLSVQNTGTYPAMFTNSEAMRTMTPRAFTIEASFKPEAGGFRTLVGRDSYGAATTNAALSALYLQIMPSDAVAIKFDDEAGYWHVAQSADGLIQGFTFPNAGQGRWYHVAAVSDGRTLSLYLADASAGGGYALVAQTDLTQSGSPNTALTAGLGSGGGWQAGNWSVGRGLYNGDHTDRAFGFIDEVRISTRALSPSQFLYALP